MELLEISNYKELPYGENVGQVASISPLEGGMEYEVLSDNSLEYLDYLNMSKVLEVLAEFFDVNSVASASENMLSGVALGSSIDNAFEKLIDANSLNILGSSVGFSKELTLDVAKQLCSMQVRNIVAPRYDKKAVEFILNNSEINVIQIKSPLQELLGATSKDVKLTPFGYLVQDLNKSKLTKSAFKVVGKQKPSQQQAEDAIFAWKVVKYTKSKSAVVVKDLVVRSIVQSRLHSVDAVEEVLDVACENSKDSVLAIDGYVDCEEIVNAAIQARAGVIIEAGDGVNSVKLAKLADKYNIVVIKTGIRNNRY